MVANCERCSSQRRCVRCLTGFLACRCHGNSHQSSGNSTWVCIYLFIHSLIHIQRAVAEFPVLIAVLLHVRISPVIAVTLPRSKTLKIDLWPRYLKWQTSCSTGSSSISSLLLRAHWNIQPQLVCWRFSITLHVVLLCADSFYCFYSSLVYIVYRYTFTCIYTGHSNCFFFYIGATVSA